MADDKAAILAALKGGQDAMPFGVGGPAEPQAWAPDVIGNVGSALVNVPKHLIDASKHAVPGLRKEDFSDDPNAPQPNQPLYNAAANTAVTLAGIGAPMAEAGAAGIFGGRLAKTADLDKLAFANKMHEARMPQSQIRDATGWFQHPADGQWRFEIPDNNARMLHFPQSTGYVKGPSEILLQHPELYKAYPELKSVKMEAYNEPKISGMFDPNAGSITVGAPNSKVASSVGVHEMQHGVQNLEGFGPGSDPSWYASQLEKELRSANPNSAYDFDKIKKLSEGAYARTSGEVESRNAQTRQNFSPSERASTHPWETQDHPYNEQLFIDPVTQMVHTLRNR